MSLILLSCYNQITIYQADEIIKIKNFEKITAMTTENKNLLNIEKWDEIFKSGNQEQMEEEMGNLQEALSDLKSEELNFQDEERSEPRRPPPPQAEEQQEIYLNREKKVDLNLFGINISEINTTVKYGLGFSLIFLIFFSVIYGLNWIKQMNTKVVKLKKIKKK